MSSDGPLPAADLDQRADDAPHHVAEESLAVDLEDEGLLVRPAATTHRVISRTVVWFRRRALRNEAKSCSPGIARDASCISVRFSGSVTCQAYRRMNGGTVRPFQMRYS